jgi:hypothetical protein
VPPWVVADHKDLWGCVEHEPEREEIQVPLTTA